jgi:hypothetical protein
MVWIPAGEEGGIMSQVRHDVNSEYRDCKKSEPPMLIFLDRRKATAQAGAQPSQQFRIGRIWTQPVSTMRTT